MANNTSMGTYNNNNDNTLVSTTGNGTVVWLL